ncbi:MAG: response regulator [Calothrix sp. SM1_5_4]|nr:response regulator [Calothrix sp. SM1_5_4]
MKSAVRVLIVEDDATLISALSTTLVPEFQLDSAYGESEALGLVNQKFYGALLVDEMLNEGSGLNVIKAARRKWPSVPAIMITAHATKQLVIDCLNQGVSRFLESRSKLGN